MFHNTLYRLERNQKKFLLALGIAFLIFSIIWFILELLSMSFPMEPLVVFIGGSATLLASFWPWKASYKNRRLSGRITFDYMSNNHLFVIGHSDLQFTLQFSKASDTTIYMYRDPQDIESIALIATAGQISEIRDATELDYSNRTVSPSEGQIVSLRNVSGNYALVHIHDIRDSSKGDSIDEVTFTYAINPDNGTDFS